jgi:hypothetical protein
VTELEKVSNLEKHNKRTGNYSTFGIGGFQMGSGLHYCIFDLETNRIFDKNAIKQA